MEMIAPDIFQIKNLLTDEQCDYLIESSEEKGVWDREGGIYYDNGFKVYFTGGRRLIDSDPEFFLDFDKMIHEKVDQKIVKEFSINIRRNRSASAYLMKSISEKLFLHHDVSSTITIFTYLNDDFSGGETVFPRQNFEYTPTKGTAIIFPSNVTHPHRVNLCDGTRYVLTYWMNFYNRQERFEKMKIELKTEAKLFL